MEPSSPNLGTLLATFLVAAVRGALDSSLLPSAPAGVARLATAKAVAAAVMDKRVVRVFKTLTSFRVKDEQGTKRLGVCMQNDAPFQALPLYYHKNAYPYH